MSEDGELWRNILVGEKKKKKKKETPWMFKKKDSGVSLFGRFSFVCLLAGHISVKSFPDRIQLRQAGLKENEKEEGEEEKLW